MPKSQFNQLLEAVATNAAASAAEAAASAAVSAVALQQPVPQPRQAALDTIDLGPC